MPKTQQVFSIPWRDTTIEITYKRVKNLSIRIVPPDGAVRISAPHWVSPAKLQQFIQDREEWIVGHRRKFQKLFSATAYQYRSGEIHFFQGKPYVLKVQEKGAEKKGEYFCVTIHPKKNLRVHWKEN